MFTGEWTTEPSDEELNTYIERGAYTKIVSRDDSSQPLGSNCRQFNSIPGKTSFVILCTGTEAEEGSVSVVTTLVGPTTGTVGPRTTIVFDASKGVRSISTTLLGSSDVVHLRPVETTSNTSYANETWNVQPILRLLRDNELGTKD